MLLLASVSANRTPSNATPPASDRPDLSALSVHYSSLSHEEGIPDGHHTATLHNGQLLIDGRRIAKPNFKPGLVSWSEKTSAYATSGCLYAMARGGQLAGVIAHGKDEASATHSVVQLAMADLTFKTEVCRTDQGSKDWVPGPPVSIGITIDAGLLFPTATLDDIDIDALPLTPGPTDPGPVIDLAIQSGQDAVGGPFDGEPWVVPVKSRIGLSLDGDTFSGTMQVVSGGPSIPWRGTAADNTPKALHAMAAPVAKTAALDLSLIDLLSLDTAQAPGIARAKFNDFTVYGMHDDWRDQLFGITKPALDDETAAIFNSHPELFTDHVSDIAILRQLANLTSDQGGPSDPISADDQKKMDYFFDHDIMAKDGYNDLSAQITQLAWERANPRLRDYINDTSQPSWAQKMYDALTSQRGLTAAVLSYLGSGRDLTQINRTTDMLLALSPRADQRLPSKDGKTSGPLATYASLYHGKIMTALGMPGFESMDFPDTPEGQKEYVDFLASWFQQLLTDAAARVDGSNPNDPNAPPPMPTPKQAMYAELEIELTAAKQLPNGLRNLAVEVVAGIAQAPGAPSKPNSLVAKLQSWSAKSLLKSSVLKAIKVGSAAYGMFNVISAFNNWTSLSDKEKAQTVILASELPINLLELAAEFEVPATMSKIINYFRTDPEAADVIERGLIIDLPDDEFFFNPILRWAAPALEDEGSEAASLFTRLFGEGSEFLKAFGIAAAVAALGFNCYQIYEDHDGSKTTIALDSLQLVAGSMMLAGAVAAMVVGECAFATLGPVGAVLGVILMIVAMIIGTPKPEKPTDKYMDDRGRNALAALSSPPPDWRKPLPLPKTTTEPAKEPTAKAA